jgi:hypothetical protein
MRVQRVRRVCQLSPAAEIVKGLLKETGTVDRCFTPIAKAKKVVPKNTRIVGAWNTADTFTKRQQKQEKQQN